MSEYLFKNTVFNELHFSTGLQRLDESFMQFLQKANEGSYQALLAYRFETRQFSPVEVSELIIEVAPRLEKFIAIFFDIDAETTRVRLETCIDGPVITFKKEFVLRNAKRRLLKNETLLPFESLDQWLTEQLSGTHDQELAVAMLACHYLMDSEKYTLEIEKLTQWCLHILRNESVRHLVKGWVSFKVPEKIDFDNLIPIVANNADLLQRKQLEHGPLRPRDGFELTDNRMSARAVQNEAHYCVYCHNNEGDFCSTGFPVKKSNPELGLKKNPLGVTLTGCPVDEKISEMNLLKSQGYTIAALAVVMIDNPMCPATGHRICNDCMMSCIYQKQDPVNIPEIETRVLTDTLNLPWGVEIYDLLTRWNPLRQKQFIAKKYNGLKIMIAGLGPAGFTLAHHMLMEGFAVVGFDGLKIEPLPTELLKNPIRNFSQLIEKLDDRCLTGFGGVAEYGITVRWDKNFLKLIYLSLSRRPYFQVFGNVRFGGTVTIDDARALGFHHFAIAVGAGLPRALSIPGSLATGMRQANDFLMALQLTGAFKPSSLANLQIRMPIIVIGGGLTGVDTATEAQAYYIGQVEKCLHRYEILTKHFGVNAVLQHFDKCSLKILHEFITHGEAVRNERQAALHDKRQPNFIPLLHRWGGVTIVYRKRIQDAPAYKANPEELQKALQEGIFYREFLDPKAVLLDDDKQVDALLCHEHSRFVEGHWHTAAKDTYLPAKCILVATGARPNVAYEFEHEGAFARQGPYYQPFELVNDQLQAAKPVEHCKVENFGPFTSYEDDDFHASFLGDSHPVFQGSVVKAIASGFRTYPKIVESLKNKVADDNDYQEFSSQMTELFTAKIVDVKRINHHTMSIVVKAPIAAQHFKPGQFYRLQNYETRAFKVGETLLQMEGIALAATRADSANGHLYFSVYESGVSTRLAALLRPGDPVALMGPTGVRSKIPETLQHHLILGNEMAAIQAIALGEKLKNSDCKLIFIGLCDESQLEDLKSLCDFIAPVDDPLEKFITFASGNCNGASLLLSDIDRITIIGNTDFLRKFKLLRDGTLKNNFKQNVKIFAGVYSPMQCMLKGVCAQCLQWQIDPKTGERTKAVFACSWQHQPLELIDIDNIDERASQNAMQERLTNLWLDYLFETQEIQRL